MISKLEKILTGLKVYSKDKRFLKNIRRSGRSLASYQLNLALKNYCKDFRSIIDVGANMGQFAIASSYVYRDAKIYSFEPVPDVFDILKENTKEINNITLFNKALGSKIGTLDFYRNAYSHASSALQIHENQKKLVPGTSDVTKITVTVDLLENFLNENNLDGPVLLKLDVQGFEKEVIKGAGDKIKDIDYILFETSFIEMYEGEPLFEEMHEYLSSLGFKILAPVGFFQTSNFQIPQMDMLYKNIR